MDTHPLTAPPAADVAARATPGYLAARVAQLEAQIAQERAENARRLREVEPKLQEFRTTMQALHQKLKRGTEERDEAETRIEAHLDAIASLHGELAVAREEVAASQRRIQELEAVAAPREADAGTLAEQAARIAELETKLALSRDRVAQMRDALVAERRNAKSEPLTVEADPDDAPPPAAAAPAPRTVDEGFPEVPGLTSEGLAERSAMGTRFRARRAEDRRAVWVIVLADPLREADLRRIDAMMQSRHPNLATTLAVAGSDCGPYLVLERTLGDTLHEWIARDGLPPERTALSMALQIARGLRHAAFHGTLHGGLSPRSVRVAPDGHVQVEDAGLADLRPAPDEPLRDARFASPERLRTGVAPDARSDIYSFGAVLHFLLTGKAPFEGDAVAVERAQKERGTPDPRALRACVSREASGFVTTLMAIDADMRPGTWDQVLVDLERIVNVETDGTPDSLRGRVARFVALHPLVACAVAAAPLVAAAVWLHFAASALPPVR